MTACCKCSNQGHYNCTSSSCHEGCIAKYWYIKLLGNAFNPQIKEDSDLWYPGASHEDLLPPSEASAKQHKEGCWQARAHHACSARHTHYIKLFWQS